MQVADQGKKKGSAMMTIEETSHDGSDPHEPGFNEEYESLSDHDLSMINPFASSRRRPLVLETDSSSSTPSTSPTASLQRPSSFSPFDPLVQGSSETSTRNRTLNSLMDDLGSDSGSPEVPVRMTQSAAGMAGFLEMEEEPPRLRENEIEAELVLEQQDDLIDFTPADTPIQTTSGLLLTHRRTAAEKRAERMSSSSSRQYRGPYPPSYRPHPTRFEVESSPWGSLRSDGFGRVPSALGQARRMLSFAKLWVMFFCAVLLIGTGVIFHTFHHRDSRRAAKSKTTDNLELTIADQAIPQVIVLRPLRNASELARQQREAEAAQQEQKGRHGSRRLLSDLEDLRTEFDNWIAKHAKVYHTDHEKEHRFGIWKDNHFRTMEKNRRHGNCPMMKQPVFGSNHLQDLTTEEFQSQFLTGYNGPNADGHEVKTGRKRTLTQTPPVMHPGLEVTRHPAIHERLLKQWALAGFTSSSSCKWYGKLMEDRKLDCTLSFCDLFQISEQSACLCTQTSRVGCAWYFSSIFMWERAGWNPNMTKTRTPILWIGVITGLSPMYENKGIVEPAGPSLQSRLSNLLTLSALARCWISRNQR
jgi:Cathepsin propeptide inhibitor domain (I29)